MRTERNDRNIPLLCQMFQFSLFFIDIKTNLLHLNSFMAKKDNNIKDRHNYVAA